MNWEKIIPGSIGLLIFGLPTAYCLWLLWLSVMSRRWPSTSGTITRAQVVVSRNRNRNASASIHYRYAVDGREYSATSVRFGEWLNGSEADARRLVASYRAGSAVTVYYHPRAPQHATLERRASGCLLPAIGLGLAAMGGIIFGILTE